jgi:predicted aconitase with swiveling domain
MMRLEAITVETGSASGAPLLLAAPLSFWGGYDAARGRIIDQQHPQCGAGLGGRVMLMERSKGSSSSSSVLAEAIRRGTGPAAIVMRERDLIVALGAIVADELYGVRVPIVVVDSAGWDQLTACTGPLYIEARSDGAIIHTGD